MERTILVIDDSELFRGLIRALLDAQGYSVIEAAQGRQGLALLRANKVDLVITDMVMPECEGVETIRAIRQENTAVPIIALSGAIGGDDYLTAARFLGATKTMDKSAISDALIDAIEHLTT